LGQGWGGWEGGGGVKGEGGGGGRGMLRGILKATDSSFSMFI